MGKLKIAIILLTLLFLINTATAQNGKHNEKCKKSPEDGSAQFLHACGGASGRVPEQIVGDAPEIERERRAYQKRRGSTEESCDPRSEAGKILRHFATGGRCGLPYRGSIDRRSSVETKGNLHEPHDTEDREHDKNGNEPPHHEHRGLFLFGASFCAEEGPKEGPEKRDDRDADQNGKREVDEIGCDDDQTIKSLRLRYEWQCERHRRCRRADDSKAHHSHLAGNLRYGRADKICEEPRAEHEAGADDHVEKIPLRSFERLRIAPRKDKIESREHDKKSDDGQHDYHKYLQGLLNELTYGAHVEGILERSVCPACGAGRGGRQKRRAPHEQRDPSNIYMFQ